MKNQVRMEWASDAYTKLERELICKALLKEARRHVESDPESTILNSLIHEFSDPENDLLTAFVTDYAFF